MAIEKRLVDGVDVYIQSNVSNLFKVFLQTYEKEDITLTSDVSIDDDEINVSSGHGISAGEFLIMYTPNYHWQIEVSAVTDDLITLDHKTFLPFSASETIIIRGSVDINAATTGVTYKFGIPGKKQPPIDISVALFILGHSTEGDDGDFGDQAALTNGLFVRKEGAELFNFGNFKTNRSFRESNAEIVYSDKGPGGTFGTNIKFNIQGQENFDQVVRIGYGDYITALRQDALNGLSYFRISLIGSYTRGE